MKTLKIILGTTYAVLILLLLLTNLRCCTISSSIEPEITLPEPSESPQPMPTPNDTIVQQAEEVGQSGALKITLLWDFQGDIDLHVKQPNGTTIYYKKKKDIFTGGFLDVDNRNGGSGAAENIYWEDPKGGNYQISLVYFSASPSTNVAEQGVCSVIVFQNGKEPIVYKVEMLHVNDRKLVATIGVD